MNITLEKLKIAYSRNQLNKLYCLQGRDIKTSERLFCYGPNVEIFNVKFEHIFPLIIYPNLEDIEINDIIIFGSCINPKFKFITKGFFKKRIEKHVIPPNDIDIAIITKNYNSNFIKDATLVQTYDMGEWLWKAGFHIIHISEDRLQKDNTTVANSIKNGRSLFKCEWKWENGLLNCYV